MEWSPPVERSTWSGLHWQSMSGTPALDPYLLWAETCQPPLDAAAWVPVMLQVKRRTARAFARLASCLPGIEVPGTYLYPAPGLEGTTYLTARVRPAFLRLLEGPLGRWVERFEYGAPVVAGTDSARFSFPVLHKEPGDLPIVVAAIDDGIGFAHSRFRRNGETRFLDFWNQDTRQGNAPMGLGYGDTIDLAYVDRCLAAGLDEDSIYRRVVYRNVRRRVSHGTHVLDMAAGSDGDLRCRLMGVQLPGATLRDTSCLGLGVNVLDAMRYLLDRVAALSAQYQAGADHQCPLLVNLSYAKLAGPHDGSSMLECAVDELVTQRQLQGPLTITLPAGNHRQARCHAVLNLAGRQSGSLQWNLLPDDLTPSFLEIWCPRGADLQITVSGPGGLAPVSVMRGQSRVLQHDGRGCALVSFLHRTSRGQGTLVLVAAGATASIDRAEVLAPHGLWKIEVLNRDTRAHRVDAWIQRDEPLAGTPRRGRQSHFVDPNYERWDAMGRPSENDTPASTIQRGGTLSALATGSHVVVVGGYRGRDDVQTTYTGQSGAMRHPDAACRVDDSRTMRGRLAAASVGGARVAVGGTSVAAPQVVRLLAPMPTHQGLAARDEVQAMAGATETHRPGPPPSSDLSGSGRLDTAPISNRPGDR